MSILGVRLGAAIPGEMQASRGALRDGVMREITVAAVGAFTLLQKVLADGNLVGIVDVAAARALRAGTCVPG